MRERRPSSGPQRIEPMLATLIEPARFAPDRGAWVYEPKLDGFRAIVIKRGRDVHMFSRNQLSFASQYPELIKALASQPLDDFIIDGEIVALTKGRSSFQHLQQRLKPVTLAEAQRSGVRIAYFAFDLLRVNGVDARPLPLRDRKNLLKQAIEFDRVIRYTAHKRGDPAALLKDACRRGLEGLIAKNADSPYHSGRSPQWLKLKCTLRQEFVIGGYSAPRGSRVALGALLVGYYEHRILKYAGKVGTGYSDKTLIQLGRTLEKIRIDATPFAPDAELPRRDVTWVKPQLVAEIEFSEWTQDGKLRHPRFLGLRTDKPAAKVRREQPE